MNRRIMHRHLPVVMMATTLAVASACSSAKGSDASGLSPTGSSTPSASGSPAPATAAVAGVLTVSNGSSDVAVGTADLTFASSVTDASWSADGSRIAYVDGDGNIATARPDGSDVVVMTKTSKNVKRAQPTWTGGEIVFSERGTDKVWRLKNIIPGPITLDSHVLPVGDLDVDGQPSGGHDQSPTSAYLAPNGAKDGVDLLAYEHDAAKGPQVWIVDYNQRSPEATLLIAGTKPALSPDGKSLAYVGTNDQLYVTPVAKASKSASVQITFGVKGITNPVWSPDGTRVAFATPTDIESVTAKLATGVTTNPVKIESSKPGTPSFVPTVTDSVVTVAAGDPIAESIAISQQVWNLQNSKVNLPSQGNLSLPSTVTLVSTSDKSALAAVGQDWARSGPILFTDGKTLDTRTAAEIKRALGKPGDPSQKLTVQVRGDSSVISDSVMQAAKALGYPVVRIKNSAEQDILTPTIIVASDTDQAVLGNLASLSESYAVILVHGSTLSTAQKAVFYSGAEVHTIGAAAHAAVAASWATKPGLTVSALPDNVIDESIAIAPQYQDPIDVVTAGDWQGMLLANAGGNAVIVIGSDATLSSSATKWFSEKGPYIANINVIGSVPDAAVKAIAALTSGPAGAAGAES